MKLFILYDKHFYHYVDKNDNPINLENISDCNYNLNTIIFDTFDNAKDRVFELDKNVAKYEIREIEINVSERYNIQTKISKM